MDCTAKNLGNKNNKIIANDSKDCSELQKLLIKEQNKNKILYEQNKKLVNVFNKLKTALEDVNKKIKDLTNKLSNNTISNNNVIMELQKTPDMN